MSRNENTQKSDDRDTNKFPKISFAKVENKFKPLENRPVMPLPPGENSGYRGNRPNNRTASNTSTSSGSSASGAPRLRDDAKPMFQRDIGFSTPSRDGSAKK